MSDRRALSRNVERRQAARCRRPGWCMPPRNSCVWSARPVVIRSPRISGRSWSSAARPRPRNDARDAIRARRSQGRVLLLQRPRSGGRGDSTELLGGSLDDPGSVTGARNAGAVRSQAVERSPGLKLSRKVRLDLFALVLRAAGHVRHRRRGWLLIAHGNQCTPGAGRLQCTAEEPLRWKLRPARSFCRRGAPIVLDGDATVFQCRV